MLFYLTAILQPELNSKVRLRSHVKIRRASHPTALALVASQLVKKKKKKSSFYGEIVAHFVLSCAMLVVLIQGTTVSLENTLPDNLLADTFCKNSQFNLLIL